MRTDQTDHQDETAARGLDSSTGPDYEAVGLKRAVLYLRVSSSSQVNTDYDPEGISIPAQRDACERKVAQMDDVEVVGEYVEPGRSGTSMAGRPSFQAMLRRIREDRDIDYVVIYKLSRMNRNRIDDALVMAQLRQHGVTLVSATEMIDDTPEGQLMHGVLASFNEFRSAADGADISYKMGEKAKRGGTLGLAPIGYRNVRETFEGREVRTIDIDPVRGPLIRQAFELYATGEHTLGTLCDEMTNRGLQTRPGRRPAGPITDSTLQRVLRDRYYLGVVTYKGQQYPGRHQPLVDQELFDAVQERLDTHSTAGERNRNHHHYLKGTIFCGACHKRGRQSRLLIQRSVGRGGTYFYFFCSAKQQKLCDEPYLPQAVVEAAIEEHYGQLRLDPDLVALIRSDLDATMADLQHATRVAQRQREARLAKLDLQEENLLDLVADGDLPSTRAKDRLRRIAAERQRIQEHHAVDSKQLDLGAEVIERTVALLDDVTDIYTRSTDHGRRLVNQAIFKKLYIVRDEVTDDELREPFADVVHLDRVIHDPHSAPADDRTGVHAVYDRLWPQETKEGRAANDCRRPLGTRTSRLAPALAGEGWSKDVLVELIGLYSNAGMLVSLIPSPEI